MRKNPGGDVNERRMRTMKPSKTPPAAPVAAEDELGSAKSLLAAYEGLASLSLDECAPGDVEAIVCAIREDRIEDAVDLIDLTGELNALDFIAEGGRDHPDPAVAQIWRYDWKDPSTRPGRWLHSVDSPKGVPLRATRTLPVKADGRWVADVGELPAFGRATLDVGLKGELFILLFSGNLVVANADGDVIGELCAGEEGYSARHFVFCRGQDAKSSGSPAHRPGRRTGPRHLVPLRQRELVRRGTGARPAQPRPIRVTRIASLPSRRLGR